MSLSTLWTVLFGVWVALELWVLFGRRASKQDSAGRDRGTLRMLWITISAAMTACGYMRQMALAPMAMPEDTLRLAAILILALGLAVRVASIVSLGSAFTATVATRSDQKLHRSGLYAVVRHPSYLGMELVFLAVGAHARDWLCLAIALVPTTAALLVRIRVEEQALGELFGAEYDDYCRQTRRLIPFVY